VKAYDFKVIRAGDLVRHNSYKDMLGIVVEIDLNYAGTPVAVAWTGRNPYGFGQE
jgi:heat shock protein HspQ